MNTKYQQVTNGTELSMALYEDKADMLVTGPLALGLFYGCKSFKRLTICLVLFFFCLSSSLSYPALMLPSAIICGGLIALFCLPLIFLGFAHISLRMLNRIRRRYEVVSFDSGMQTLILHRHCEYDGVPHEMNMRRPVAAASKAHGKANNPYSRI